MTTLSPELWRALTYCTNIHPAQTLEQVERAIVETTTRVAELMTARNPGREPFSVGLRLSAEAAATLVEGERLAAFAALLRERALFVQTINGFPYGAFHGQVVKAGVYLPDWSQPERVAYTNDLIASLKGLLPKDAAGSISTVPLMFKANTTPAALSRCRRHLLTVAASLAELERATGQCINLALEPEPGCVLETTNEVLDFFENQLFTNEAQQELRALTRCAQHEAEALARRHLGICLDTCHASVEFETPLDAYRVYERHGICVSKVQISAGLELQRTDDSKLNALAQFDEPVYLHQVVVSDGEGIVRFDDLPLALAAAERGPSKGAARDAGASGSAGAERWRVHFHVPLFTSSFGVFRSTRTDLEPLLAYLRQLPAPPHLEVETYTWDVLPPQFRDRPLATAIAAELEWVTQRLLGEEELSA
ncbi:MAG TPA: metabolite traffic protein EboE [Polyangiaceae bacterium]|nr:metabolite traffic protein EboE [Polyangiaceae bacterium]